MSVMHVGLAELERDFGKISIIPDDTASEMLGASTNIMADETRYTAEAMLHGPYYKGVIKKSVSVSKMKKSKGYRSMYVKFRGRVKDEKHPNGESIARIAYINEYGKKNQPARPFIKEATYRGTDAAADAATVIYDEFLRKHNL